MKRLLASTAVALCVIAPAWAQDTTSPFAEPNAEISQMSAADLLGKRVYRAETAHDGSAINDPGEGWDDIGEVSDIILSQDGATRAILLDIGGFLGIGEKTVAVNLDSLDFVHDGDSEDDFFIVLTAERALLEDAPAYDTAGLSEWWGDGEADNAEASDQASIEVNSGDQAAEQTDEQMAAESEAADAEQTDEQMAAEGEAADAQQTDEQMAAEGEAADAEQTDEQIAADSAAAPTVEGESSAGQVAETTPTAPVEGESTMAQGGFDEPFEGYEFVDAAKMTAEQLDGMPVFDPNNERVGEIGEIMLLDDGKIDFVVIDVGGFLGLGEKPVQVAFQDLSIQAQEGSDDLRGYINMTEEQLDAQPAYEEIK